MQSNEAEAFRKEALDVLEQEFGASPLFVLKDPRICRLVPFWRDVLTEAGARPVAILPFRNPLEVAASLHRRNGFKPAFGHLLWLRHALEAEAASRKLPRVFLSYDSLLASWTHVSERIESQLGLALPRKSDAAKAEIESFLTDKLRHHRETPERATDDPALSRWLRDTYRILSRWSKVGEEDTDYTALDAILREFNAAVPAFANLVDAGNTATSLQQTREMVAARAASELGRLVATLLEDRSNPFLSKQARMRRAMKLVQRSGIFDAEWYLDRYQDVAENGIEPTRHYVLHGAREGRLPNGRIGD